jgi:hypothetical protein
MLGAFGWKMAIFGWPRPRDDGAAISYQLSGDHTSNTEMVVAPGQLKAKLGPPGLKKITHRSLRNICQRPKRKVRNISTRIISSSAVVNPSNIVRNRFTH